MGQKSIDEIYGCPILKWITMTCHKNAKQLLHSGKHFYSRIYSSIFSIMNGSVRWGFNSCVRKSLLWVGIHSIVAYYSAYYEIWMGLLGWDFTHFAVLKLVWRSTLLKSCLSINHILFLVANWNWWHSNFLINSSSPGQNDCHFIDNIFKCIFIN